jgi:YfiH family protein
MRHLSPKIFSSQKIIAAISTRNGGVSKGCFSSLNTGRSTSDDKNDVEENRKLFFSDLGIDESDAALSYQVHGCEILKADNACRENGYDAIITDKRNLTLIVSIADCTPILIHDPVKNVIAAIHAAWRGTVSQIVRKTLEKMGTDYGIQPQNCLMYIGPCIGFDHFEVGKEVAEHFSGNLKRFDTSNEKYFVDLKKANKIQGMMAGIPEQNIEISDLCTFCEENLFFSHRRDKGNTGRMIAVIRMRQKS